jgi:phosphonoacetaldehyde methylase
MNQDIRGGIGTRLGNNELSEYLSNKDETSRIDLRLPIAEYIECSYLKGIEKIKVTLSNPAITIPNDVSKRCIPPLGLLYIASFLEKKGINVSMLDCVVEGYHKEIYHKDGLMTYGLPAEDAAKIILKNNPDVIGLSVLFSTDLPNLIELSCALKKNNPNVLIVVGGLHPTIYPKDIWDACKDSKGNRVIEFIIRGEGEERFYELLLDLIGGKLNVKMDGLCGAVNNEFFINHQVGTISKLDSIPFPAYHLLPMEKYFSINIPFSPVPQGSRVMQIMTTRGCPVGCSFCASTNMYKKYRMRSVENVIDEIKFLKEKYNIDEVQFADDNIFFNKKRSIDLFNKLALIDVIWCTPNGVMINTLSDDLLDILKDSGLYQITLSIDSGSVKTLKKLQHKPVKLNTIPGLVKRCNELGIFSHATLVVGLPGESIEEICKGFDFVYELNLTSISVFIAAAIPGSELYHNALESNLITKEKANRINTTKSDIHLSDISKKTLEDMVMSFQRAFTDKVKNRNPDMWRKKYSFLIKKDESFDKALGGRLT